ncbi:MAG: hypothetical protein G01um101433_1080, partial [Parcubacteria group bacterium Gr01-1014_33]
MMPQLSIVSVYHSRESKEELEQNYNLVSAMNPDVHFEWLAGDNTQDDVLPKIDPVKFRVFRGAGNEFWGYKPGWASLRHATALHNVFPHARNRFLLIIDPDFYIVRKNWIREVTLHMEKQKLAFFGSIWHPRYYSKYRYFPTTHCLFIDLEKVQLAELTFMPGDAKESHSKLMKIIKKFPRLLHRSLFGLTFQNRVFIGDSRDAGYEFFKKFYGRPGIHYGLLTAVYSPFRELHFPANILYLPNRFIEFFLPDRLCFIPKKKGYFVSQGFRELGCPDIRGMNPDWEEYLWQGKPFGVHLRGTKSKT